MRGGGHTCAILSPFPAVKFLIPLFSYCVFMLLPSSKGVEKLLLVLFLLLSDAVGKLVLQRGEGTGQADEDYCIVELLSDMCLSRGMEP